MRLKNRVSFLPPKTPSRTKTCIGKKGDDTKLVATNTCIAFEERITLNSSKSIGLNLTLIQYGCLSWGEPQPPSLEPELSRVLKPENPTRR
jgi:hypothetical protein